MEFMTVTEYAAHVKSSVSKIRDMCHKHELPCCKLGLKWIIDVQSADEYIYTRCHEKASQTPPKRAREHFRSTYNGDFTADLKRLRGAV